MLEIESQSTISGLDQLWQELVKTTNSHPIFSSYCWNQVFLEEIGHEVKPLILLVKEKGQLIALAPFKENNQEVSFIADIGETDSIADKLGIICKQEDLKRVWSAVLNYLKIAGFRLLIAHNVGEGEKKILTDSKYNLKHYQEEKAYQLELPGTFDGYLQQLPKKHRHELRRKIRRLDELNWQFKIVKNEEIDWHRFFELMRKDNAKREFLTLERENFFKNLSKLIGKDINLEMGTLEVDGRPVSMAFTFVTNGDVLLYNSGYEREFNQYSVGLLAKAFLIKQSIENKKKVFDFLNGDERYKHELGGQEYYRYRVTLAL